MPPLFLLDTSDEPTSPAWLLFDCSEGARWRIAEAGVDPSDIAHVFVSHPHADHAALPQFVQGRACEAIFRPGRDYTLTLYLPAPSAQALPSLWSWHQPEDHGVATSRYPLHVVPLSQGSEQRPLPNVRLLSFAVHHGHGHNPALAFRVEARGKVFAYSGDSGLCDGLLDAARGADLLVCEASSRIGVDMARSYGHLSPQQAASIAKQKGVKRLLLTHYSGLDSAEAMLADARESGYEGELFIGQDGDELSF